MLLLDDLDQPEQGRAGGHGDLGLAVQPSVRPHRDQVSEHPEQHEDQRTARHQLGQGRRRGAAGQQWWFDDPNRWPRALLVGGLLLFHLERRQLALCRFERLAGAGRARPGP